MTIQVEKGYGEWKVNYVEEFHLINTGLFCAAKWWITGVENKRFGSFLRASDHQFIICLN